MTQTVKKKPLRKFLMEKVKNTTGIRPMKVAKRKLSATAEDLLIDTIALLAIAILGTIALSVVILLVPLAVITVMVLSLIVLWEEYGIRNENNSSSK